MAAPKSRIKIGLDDDPTKGLNQAASFPGAGAGSSTPRAVQDVGVLRSAGVKTTTDVLRDTVVPGSGEDQAPEATGKPPTSIGLGEVTPREQLNFESLGEGGFNLTDRRTGKPAIGWIVLGGKPIPASAITPDMFSKILAISEAQFGGAQIPIERPSTAFPTFPDGAAPTDTVGQGPTSGGKGSGAPLREEDDEFDLKEFLKQFETDSKPGAAGEDPVQKAYEELLAAVSTDNTTYAERVKALINNPNLAGLVGRASVPVTAVMWNTFSQNTQNMLSTVGFHPGIRIGFGITKITTGKGTSKERTEEVGVLINLDTEQPLLGLDDNEIKAPGAQEAIDLAATLGAELFKDARTVTTGGLSSVDVDTRKEILSAAITDASFAAQTAITASAQQIQTVLGETLLGEREAAARKSTQDFQNEQRIENEKFAETTADALATNQMRIDANRVELETALRKMELEFLHGNAKEAAESRRWARELEGRSIRLEERTLLITTLSVLGQHPQLRGLIQALGIFDGKIVGEDFDLGAFFRSEIPLGQIPSAQMFGRMTPGQQEATVNELAGKFGVSPESIIATIRQQAPIGTRRLQ